MEKRFLTAMELYQLIKTHPSQYGKIFLIFKLNTSEKCNSASDHVSGVWVEESEFLAMLRDTNSSPRAENYPFEVLVKSGKVDGWERFNYTVFANY